MFGLKGYTLELVRTFSTNLNINLAMSDINLGVVFFLKLGKIVHFGKWK